jgi:hypothetical protein
LTAEDIAALADVLSRELEACESSPNAQSWRRVLINFALQGVHLQTLHDMQPGAST